MTSQTQVSVQAQVFIPRDYQVFAGLDVDKHSIAVTFCNHEGLLRSLRLPYSAPQLLSYVRKHFPEQRLAFVYEAGPTGFGLYDELVAEGHPCLVVAPPMVPTAPGARVKTNRLDSKKLSEGLRGGQLRSIHVPSAKYRELRHLVQLRDTQVQQLTAAKCRIKALQALNDIS
jgi:transposase